MSENFPVLRFIVLFPFVGFLINLLFSRIITKMFSAIVATAAVFISFLLSSYSVLKLANSQTPYLSDTFFWWINQEFLKVPFRFYLDNISSVMILVVSGVGFLIHLYSISYMHADKDLKRFFSYLNLFVFFMLILVLSDNIIITFFGWEGVGLCSYLLIGFWYENIENSKAAKKAFILNRIGDLFFILAIVVIYLIFSKNGIYEFSYNRIISSVDTLANSTFFNIPFSTIIAILLFIASCGKSAQFPLYVWLPDAMAGPTPVSALIHAATMVTAGVYLLARLFPLYSISSTALSIIMWVSTFTAFLSALIAIGQRDIKKILAYSTISQLGYMFMAVSSYNWQGGIFHLFTHAFFKALLFLSAGAIIHSLGGVQDIFQMGALKSKLKDVFIVMLAGYLAIIGFPYTSGYFSKENIIEGLYIFGNFKIWLLSLLTAFLTSLYMTRMIVIVFLRKPKVSYHIHKPDMIMMIPLYILAFFSIFIGFIAPLFLKSLNASLHHEIPLLVKYSPTLAMIAGVWIGYILYIEERKFLIPLISKLVYNKFYVDEIYQGIIVKPIEHLASLTATYIDKGFIDGFFIGGIGYIFRKLSRFSSKMENSNIHWYVAYMLLSVVIFLIFLIKGDL